jgi:U4/U6.U5 tri-snRNP-associated protein 2
MSMESTAPPANGNGNRKRKAEADDGEQDVLSACPYLDTIQRSLLDFDFEPACSVSMQTGPHIYGCLSCGKYFRGRGSQTPAYTHSVDESHFVFVHLSKGTFHCLPDDYEIKDASLADISAALHPTFSPTDLASIDSNTGLSRDLFGRRYLPGFVGLNNLNKTDCVNAVVQALAHVRPLRDFFLSQSDHSTVLASTKKVGVATSSSHRLSQQVAHCFGEVVRRIWSDKRFKSHVDPHMLIQAITVASKKKFQVGQQIEAGEFMTWFLHQLHVGTGGTKKSGSSIVHRVFQGKIRVAAKQAKIEEANDKDENIDGRAGSDNEEDEGNTGEKKDAAESQLKIEETTTDTRFLQLTLDIPEKALFRDEDGGLVIPQEPLVNVLKKFDGVTFSDAISRSGAAQRKLYKLLKLPDYLILHLARFTTNRYSREKNPSIVAFPVKNLDLSDYVFVEGGRPTVPSEKEVREMNVSTCDG